MIDSSAQIEALQRENEALRQQVIRLEEQHTRIAQDLSAGQQAEQQLQILKQSVDLAPDATYWMDRDGRFLYVNDAACQMLGYTRDELMQLRIFDINPKAVLATWAQVWQLLAAGGEFRGESVHRRKDGTEFPVELASAYIKLGDQEYIYGFATGITERKQAEELLQQKNESLVTLLNISQSLTRTLNLTVVLQTIVDDATRLTWLDAGAIYLLRGESLYLGATTPPLPADFPEIFRQAPLADHPHIRQAVTTGDMVFLPDTGTADLTPAERQVSEARHLRSLLYLPLLIETRAMGALILGTGGETVRSFSEAEIDLYRTMAGQAALAIENAHLYEESQRYAVELELDMVERKRVEEEIRCLNASLEQRVADRTRELAEANVRLQELDALKSKFVSDVSHELRTPVTNLSLYLSLLEHGKTEKRAHYVQMLNAQTARLAQLIEDILDLSRLEREAAEMIFAPINLNDLIERVVLIHQPRAEAAGLQLICRVDPDLPLVSGEIRRLEQVITNLVVNAVNYTAAGQVQIVTRRAGGQACVEVVDTGPGIDAQDLPHLFERFYRGERAKHSGVPGTGLGLSIVKEIIERHDGTISVESRVGYGSAFIVRLPVNHP